MPQTLTIRYTTPDVLRGLAILSMVIYHAMWDIVYIFGVNIAWYKSLTAFVWQQSICWGFILLSGFCQAFGRGSFKRGLLVLVCSAIISAVTIIAMPAQAIRFGVLTLLGSCMLIAFLLHKFLLHVKPILGFIISIVLFAFCRNVNTGFFGFGALDLFPVPPSLYANSFTAFLGFPPESFFSTDYFSLIPWMFLFFAGYFLCRILQKHQKTACLNVLHFRPLEFIGRHSLIIYMLHQPIIYGVLTLVFKII